jgi:antitoxin ParD1/3/4
MNKTASLNIPLTDEMKKFVTSQSGDGTFFSTPSEYIRALIRADKDRQEANQLRTSIIDGYQDVIQKKVVKFSGNLKSDMTSIDE